MDAEIKPALTPEEWLDRSFHAKYGIAATSAHVDHKGRCFFHSQVSGEDKDLVILNESYTDAPHKLAALCLYGRSEGFTQEDVQLIAGRIGGLTVLVRYAEGQRAKASDPAADEAVRSGNAEIAALRALAARIAALLPPSA